MTGDIPVTDSLRGMDVAAFINAVNANLARLSEGASSTQSYTARAIRERSVASASLETFSTKHH